MQRRQVVDHRRAVSGQQGLDGGKDTPVQRNAAGKLALHRDRSVAGDQGRRRAAAHKGPPPPPLGMLDGLKEEGPIGRAVTGQASKRPDGRGEIGQEFPPDGHDRVVPGQGGEVVAARTAHGAAPSGGGPNGR